MEREATMDAPRACESLWFLNTWVTIRRPSAAGDDGVSIIEHRMPYGDSPPMHVHHDEDEIFHVLEGRVRLRVGERELVAGPGQTFVAPRGLPHGYRVESPCGARCLTITTGAGFETMLRAASRPAAASMLPPQAAPTPEQVEALGRLCAANGIDLVGPPMEASA
jgi:quercetin dioxygenase-like cupin family protein